MNDLLIIDMLPTYGLLFYLLISVFVFVGMPWSAPEDLGSWPAAFCRRRVLGCFRARRRVRCAGVYHGSAFGAAGYGRLLPHVPARALIFLLGLFIIQFVFGVAAVYRESNLVYPAINALTDTCCLSVNTP